MPFDGSQFSNPGQFADYGFYSGMNGQMKSLTEAAQEEALKGAGGGGGIAPPETFGQFAEQRLNQAVAPVTQTFNKLSNVATQASQGNVGAAYGAYKNPAPAQNTNVFDFSSNPFRN